jgi:nucleoside-diphosphate-sugar epimerase
MEHEVVLMDRRPLPEERDDVRHDLPFLLGDLTNREDCLRATEGIEAIAHLGAIAGAGPQTFATNTVSTWNLYEAAQYHGVKRVAFASSINALGLGPYRISEKGFPLQKLPIDESVPADPQDNYAVSKYVNEITARAFFSAYGIRTHCLRLCGIWRPDWFEHYHPRPLEQLKRPNHEGHLVSTWHYVHSVDAAEAFRLSLETDNAPDFAIYYVVAPFTNRPEPTRDLIARFLPHWLPLAEGIEGRQGLYSTAKIERELGWRARYLLSEERWKGDAS